MAKLTEQAVTEIRNLYKSGWSQQAIANKYGVYQTIISAVVRRQAWRHVN
jgi:uncharacterized protein YjcR